MKIIKEFINNFTSLELFYLGFLLGGITTLLILPKERNIPCIETTDTIYVDTLRVKATYYNNTKGQCDDSPNITANNTKITRKHDKKAVALSRDLLKRFKYGDSITVVSPKHLAGKYLIFDTMHKRFKNRIDFFTYFKINVDSVTIKI